MCCTQAIIQSGAGKITKGKYSSDGEKLCRKRNPGYDFKKPHEKYPGAPFNRHILLLDSHRRLFSSFKWSLGGWVGNNIFSFTLQMGLRHEVWIQIHGFAPTLYRKGQPNLSYTDLNCSKIWEYSHPGLWLCLAMD